MNAKFILFLSCFAAMTLIPSAVNAAPRSGGGHGGHGGHHAYHGGHGEYHGGHSVHFSSISPRGGHKFSGSGSTFSRGRKWNGNWSSRNWSGRKWSWGNWSGGDRFIFVGGFGYPYYWNWYPYWGWGVPYAFNYGYYSYGYNPSYGYNYDYYSDPTYGYGYADRSSIVQLQRRLARAGYYYGAIDGIMGPQTRRAIRAYERTHNQREYGAIDRY